jgi:NhaA family Na+:H+ antiporter
LTNTFRRFVDSEKSGGFLLFACTVVSLLIANSAAGAGYTEWWQTRVGGLTLEHWVNDALMAIFFLLIGLELERELYAGELSNVRNALLPIVAAVGGMLAPALIHLSLNAGTTAQAGFGIPMATDIAFALAVLALLGGRVPASLRVLVVAFAVIDDLGAVILIAIFYTAEISVGYLAAALGVWGLLCVLNRPLRVMSLAPYLAGGAVMWFLMLKSGVHATLAGVMLAFAIPFTSKDEDASSPSFRLEHALHKPVAFLVLPFFALANTAIPIAGGWAQDLAGANSLGIAGGLIIGKPLGVVLFCLAAVAIGICRLPPDLKWRHVIGAGLLGGIGFTMSIFITNLAFAGDAQAINASKMAVLMASLTAGAAGFLWLLLAARSVPPER